jgi:hypothetical protein
MEFAMRVVFALMFVVLGVSGCFPANRGYGNNGYGNRDWDRYRHTVSHPIPGSGQVAEIR